MKHTLHILNSRERKQLKQELDEQFGITELPEKVYFSVGRKKDIYVTNREVFAVDHTNLRVKASGMQFATRKEKRILLSIEASQMLGSQAQHHIMKLSSEQQESWLQRKDIICTDSQLDGSAVLLACKSDFLGSGVVKKGKVVNNLARTRTLKNIFSLQKGKENCLSCQ